MTKVALRDLLVKRILQAIVTIFIVLAFDFAIFHLMPGSIIDRLANNPNLNEAVIEQIIRQFGLDLPLSVQFVRFITNFLQGNFGISFFYGAEFNIGAIIGERLVNTLFLMIPANIFSIALGIWVGKNAAWFRGKARDAVGLFISLVTYAIPGFWLGMIAVLIFGFKLQLVPTEPYNLFRSFNEYGSNFLGFLVDAIAHLFLPILILVIVIFGVFTLIMRNSLLDVISEDYMLTAKAKGLSDKDQLNKEAVPNARIPVATVIAIQMGFSVVGALLIEIVFNYHGIGRLIWDAVVHRDFPMLQATFFVFTVVLVVTNLIADFLYYYMDPRIRVEGEAKITEKGTSVLSRKRPTLSTAVLILLVILDLFALVLTPRIILQVILLTIAVSLVVERRRVLGYLRMFTHQYRISNLRFIWKSRKVKLFNSVANLLIMIGLLLISFMLITIIMNFPFVPPEAWSVSINMIVIGIVCKLIGAIAEKPERVSTTYNEIIQNRLGFVGLIVVALFAGIAIFGDVIAPYDPKLIGAGPSFQPPTALPQAPGLVLSISLVLLFIGILLWLYSNHRGMSEVPSYFRLTSFGILVIEIGIALAVASFIKNILPSLIAAIVLVFLGGVYSFRIIWRYRDTQRPTLRTNIPRISALSILFAGCSFLIYFLYLLMTYQPTGIIDFHILGTDQLGHDLFSGIIIGTRITLMIGLLATSVAITIGTTIGLVAGFYGGRLDALLMRFTDMFFVIPAFVLMIIVAAVVGPSLITMLIVIGIFSWATTARIVRGQVLSIKERGYIERIRSVGGGNFYIMTRHVLPAVVPLIIVQTALTVMNSIFFEISLDFVGLGDPSIVSWGSLLFLAYNMGISIGMDWLVMFPGFAIVTLLVGISFLAFGLDEVTNPRLRRR
ncbi:MAG: ABC transporter permease subunit [Candidatus Thorarchaeota archaeon]